MMSFCIFGPFGKKGGNSEEKLFVYLGFILNVIKIIETKVHINVD